MCKGRWQLFWSGGTQIAKSDSERSLSKTHCPPWCHQQAAVTWGQIPQETKGVCSVHIPFDIRPRFSRFCQRHRLLPYFHVMSGVFCFPSADKHRADTCSLALQRKGAVLQKYHGLQESSQLCSLGAGLPPFLLHVWARRPSPAAATGHPARPHEMF